MIFILSSGRSGSTFLSETISATGIVHIEHQESGSRIVNILGNMVLQNIISIDTALSFIRKLNYEHLFHKSNSDPLRSCMIAALFKTGYFDDVKVIHLIRDPRNFVSSFMNWKRDSLKRKILHHLIPFWQPTPRIKKEGKESFKESILISKFEHFCWNWSFKNSIFLEIKDYTDQYMLVKFEDLVLNRDYEVEKLANFIGLELSEFQIILDSGKVNKSKSSKFPKWNEWSPYQAKILQKRCGILMNEFGYGNEESWKKLVK